jgi:protein disulfide-isomerase
MRTALLSLCCSVCLLAASEQPTWQTDWDQARDIAKAQDKPMLVDFTGSDWCVWCIRLKQEVFQTEAFQDWATEHVVLVELDFPSQKQQNDELKQQNQRLAQKYGIQGFPTIVFVDHSGKELTRLGYESGGPQAWIAKAKAQLGW